MLEHFTNGLKKSKLQEVKITSLLTSLLGIYESFVSELLQEQEVDQADFRQKVDAIGER
jgi:hypothetical protein